MGENEKNRAGTSSVGYSCADMGGLKLHTGLHLSFHM